MSGRARIKERSPTSVPGPHQRTLARERSLMRTRPLKWSNGSGARGCERSLMRAQPLKWSNGSGARDLNSTRLPSVLARFSFPGEGSLGTRLCIYSCLYIHVLMYLCRIVRIISPWCTISPPPLQLCIGIGRLYMVYSYNVL